ESYFAMGTYALTGTWRENAERFFRNPACNSRFYGLFRTRVLRSAFPTRGFFAYDLAVSAGTIKSGKHAELPECLMFRDASAFAAYERAARNDHWFLPWQLFPLLLMTSTAYAGATYRGRSRDSMLCSSSISTLHSHLDCLSSVRLDDATSKPT